MIIPDISMYQDRNDTPLGVDFGKMKVQTPAVIIRAGQNLWRDPDFAYNWKASKDAGLLRGSYWFYDSRVRPKEQAELWVSTLGGDLGELPMWCDFEDRYGGVYTGWRHWYDFMQSLRTLVPNKQLGIYTGFYYWKEHTSAPLATKAQRDYFKQYPLWIANYNPIDSPPIPDPFDNWVLWQYTDNGNGESYGVESKNIDLNYFNGDYDDFLRVFNVNKKESTMIADFNGVQAEYKNV